MRSLRILAVAALITGGLHGCAPRSEAQAPAGPPPVTVATPLQQEVVEWDEFTGRFEAVEAVEVRARVGGYVQAVHFRDGQMVRRGQLLFTLDPRPAQAALAAAEAQLAQAEAQLELARARFARSEGLLASQAVSQAEADADRAGLRTAEANLAAARSTVQARRLDLEFTRVTAPISGRVSDRRVDPGNLIGGGSSAGDILTTVVADGPLHFAFEGSEALLLKYQRQGANGRPTPVSIRLQDEPDYRWNGRLDFTDNALDGASGTIRLRAVVANPQGFLRPGMFGAARVAGSQAYDALLVPDSAIVTDQTRKVVLVVAADGTVTPRPVELGPISDGLRVIRSGLSATDRVVIGGQQRAMPGQKVTPQAGRITPAPGRSEAPTVTVAPAATATPANALPSR
ncbi:MAG TPA: efflux RND transporter periplasmic adaptor subunit [Brevundimonas sp.]|jgi:RND family efflux transporter MFP subunit|uniref:efflux RND transporter periplasmic adaptor subunit n=1 Tax=Brevundimonas sp. TaxID=1871086 RepID=UPI002E148FA9|nr:efflux RND transporter periplasmic adaptor subunit [Brevundimonas sp.]